MLTRYLLAWFALAVIATLNGILRETTYGKKVSELRAHQISTVTAIILTGFFVYSLNLVWPIESSRQAWTIGVAWFVFTLIFEFIFGHYVFKNSWSKLLADYILQKGRVWSLFLLWILLLPVIVYRLL